MNRLANEQSPYLLQHADNPVDWYPWGEEAFQKAKEEEERRQAEEAKRGEEGEEGEAQEIKAWQILIFIVIFIVIFRLFFGFRVFKYI